MNRRIPDDKVAWMTFPRSPMEIAAAVGITVMVGVALMVLFNMPGVMAVTMLAADLTP